MHRPYWAPDDREFRKVVSLKAISRFLSYAQTTLCQLTRFVEVEVRAQIRGRAADLRGVTGD